MRNVLPGSSHSQQSHPGAPSAAALAESVLAEVPEQMLSFMRANGIAPGSKHRPPAATAVK
jgi:hypothetical protein